MSNVKLVGYKRFTSKKGVNYCVANVVSEYNDRDKENNCFGSKVEEIFLPDSAYDLLTPKDIGHELSLQYDIVGNRAYIAGVKVL